MTIPAAVNDQGTFGHFDPFESRIYLPRTTRGEQCGELVELRREAAAKGVFSAHARLDELQEIFAPAGLGSDAGEAESTEVLPADERAGDAAIQIEISNAEFAPGLFKMRWLSTEHAARELVRHAVGDGEGFVEV